MSMTQESDSSEEFYDAEDLTLKGNGKKRSPKVTSTSVTKDDGFKFPTEITKMASVQEHSKVSQSQPNLAKISTEDILEFVEPKPTGRQRFRDIRQTMQNEEDDNIGNTLTPESQNSSSEGVYPHRTTHKFRIIEHDTASIQSMTSLGRVGRILGGNIDPSAISVGRESVNLLTKSSSSQHIQSQLSQISQLSETDLENEVLNKIDTLSVKTNESVESSASSTTTQHQHQLVSDTCSATKMNFQDKKIYIEPDVIASTKLAHSKTSDNLISSRPVVPPRKKRNTKKLSTSSSENFNPNDDLATIGGGSNDDNQKDDNQPMSISNKTHNYIIDNNSDSEADSKSIKSKSEQAPPVTKKETVIEKLQRELENEFSNNDNHNMACASDEFGGGSKTYKSASLNRIYNSLGNSSTSINSRPSPSNSAKSNSAPSRGSSIDPTQGLNLYKATRGRYVVKPQDEVTNKADGPTFDEMERIQAEIFKSTSRDRVNLAGTGTNSLGSGSRYEHLSSFKSKTLKDRRKSAGDEEIIKQLNVPVRTRTDSGKQLSDIEILQQVPVKNLDTGENFPLSVIEDKLPELKEKMNPLSFHIMRLTSEVPEMDEEAGVDIPAEVPPVDEDENDFEEGSRIKRKTERIRRFFGSTMRKTVDKARSIASEVSHARHKEDVADVVDVVNPEQNIKIKASNTNKGPYEFAKLQHVQDLSGEHTGAVWCMKFSSCGRLLATAGQDKYLRIWVLKDAYPFFQDMRNKYNTEKSSPTPSQESLVSQSSSTEEAIAMATAAEKSIGPFMPKAFCTYSGHTSDLLDVSWSKNYFILSSSMDKTVRLWHISRKECLCCFQHIDFVTAIAFHPRDDRYFLSGSLDGKLRLWNIPDKKVALWNELDGQTKLITAANFCQNGKFAVVGSYDGRCIFYTTDQLKYHTQIHVRSTRGRNKTGRKISGIEPMPGEDKILVTSNDSRIRLYDLRDLNLSCKYKGYLNASSQIKASFSHDGKYIISGSENQQIYTWKTHHDYAKLSSVRRDRNDFWEGIKAHNATVTCAIFAPHPEAIIKPDPDEMSSEEAQNYTPDPLVEQHKKGCGYVLVSADFSGAIKVFINKTKPKHSSLPYTAIMD